MAITLDKALGSQTKTNMGSSAGTSVITTTQIAAAGSRIVLTASWFDSAGTTVFTVSDSGGTYTLDKQFNNGSDRFAVYSRVLVGSLASSSAITLSYTAGATSGGLFMAACSYLGTTAVDTTSTNATTGTGFSSGAASNSIADALFVGGAGNETALTSVGTVNTNGTPRFDLWDSGGSQQGMRMLDLIASTIGSQALTGSWGATGTQSSTSSTGVLVIYKGTAGAASAAPFGHPNLPFMAPQGGIL